MKKFYTFLLTALMLMGVSMQASAGLTTKITWDTPGAVQIYVGSTAAKNLVSLPEGATEYTAYIDDEWGTTYVKAGQGYVLVNGVCEETGATIPLGGFNKDQVNIDMDTYNNLTVHVNAEPIVYDGEIEVNVVNGAGKLLFCFDATNREVDLKTGVQTVAYSTAHESSTISITFPSAYAEDPYLKVNGEDKTLTTWLGNLMYRKQAFSNGDKFELKLCNTDDPAAATATVKMQYENEMARNAVNMFFNKTQGKSISERDEFEVNKGDLLWLTFNTKDYTVVVDGQTLPSSEDRYTYATTVNEDATITVSASERSYGNVDITFNLLSSEGLKANVGSTDGEEIDFSSLSASGIASCSYTNPNTGLSTTYTLSTYTVSVSSKNPKIFFSAAEGYWIEGSFYLDGKDILESSMAAPDYTLNVINHKIEKTAKLAVYVAVEKANATIANVTLRDRERNTYTLQEGYNIFDFDPAYSTPLTVVPLNVDEEVPFNVFNNMVAVSKDGDTGTFIAQVSGNTSLHIFAGRAAAAKQTLTVHNDLQVGKARILRDQVIPVDDDATSFTAFKNTQVIIYPGENPDAESGMDALTIDGKPKSVYNSFKLTVTNDHSIALGAAKMTVSPADEETVEEFTGITVSFPGATSAVRNENVAEDEFAMMASDWSAGSMGCTVEEVEGADCPTFIIRPVLMGTTAGKNFSITIPEGFFLVDSYYPNADAWYSITITGKAVNTDEIPVLFSPTTEQVLLSDFEGCLVMVGEEYGEYEIQVDVNKLDFIELALNGTPLEMWEDYDISLDSNTLYFGINKDVLQEGTLTLSLPEGFLMIGSSSFRAITNSWTLIDDNRTYEIRINTSLENINEEMEIATLDEMGEFFICFPDAATAEIFNENGAELIEYTEIAARAESSNYCTIATVEAVEEAAAPTFKLTFSPAPTAAGTYRLLVKEGMFTLDSLHQSPEYTKLFENMNSGVLDFVVDENGNVTVVAIDGRVLLRNAPADAVRTLPRGLYIINGKKAINK